MFPLLAFKIEKLFGLCDVAVRFADDTVVLVGENGTGKSTVLNSLYYVLTYNWDRLLEIEFLAIEVEFHKESVRVTKDDIIAWKKGKSLLSERLVQRSYDAMSELWIPQAHLRGQQCDEGLAEFLFELRRTGRSDGSRMPLNSPVSDALVATLKVKRFVETVKGNFPYPVLYLPTYRRIERDLSEIFLANDNPRRSLRRFYNHTNKMSERDNYVELVEFGMHDVEDLFKQFRDRLCRSLQSKVDRLLANHIRDLIGMDGGEPLVGEGVSMLEDYRLRYSNSTVSKSTLLDEDIVEAALGRVQDGMLDEAGKKRVLKMMMERSGTREAKDSVLSRFVARLVFLHLEQEAEEEALHYFVDVVNKYLFMKKVEFNQSTYDIVVRSTIPGHLGNLVSLARLSSGEKQIVSLFSHLCLFGRGEEDAKGVNEGYFVIIDEPELSLSIDWQERFLVDLRGSRFCSGIFAVTHSPFIVKDLSVAKCTRGIGEVLTYGQS